MPVVGFVGIKLSLAVIYSDNCYYFRLQVGYGQLGKAQIIYRGDCPGADARYDQNVKE